MANRTTKIREESPWLTPAEAAAYLKIGRTKLREMRAALGARLLNGKHWRYHRANLDAAMANPWGSAR